jgi:flagellar basal body-associated protein FliL
VATLLWILAIVLVIAGIVTAIPAPVTDGAENQTVTRSAQNEQAHRVKAYVASTTSLVVS